MSATIIDDRKVSLAEKDIEDWLWENPEAVHLGYGSGDHVVKWIGRQLKVPSGIIDLLGIDDNNDLVVVEVKNTDITAGALTQVSRYAKDIREIVYLASSIYTFETNKVVIGKGEISNEILYEANALEITLQSFVVKLELETSYFWHFSNEHDERVQDSYLEIAKSNTFDCIRELVEKFDKEAEQAVNELNQEDQSSDEPNIDIVDEARRIISEDHNKEE